MEDNNFLVTNNELTSIRQNISFHYDVSNKFYALFLGASMCYSCAYFKDKEDDLDKAQEQKLDHICRKLRLRPGDNFLDIGCGWGGLIAWATKNYGTVSTGITLSKEQAALATERITAAGLASKCRIIVADYREIRGQFDKVASVGMFEHVGKKNYHKYLECVSTLLPEKGIFLNHGITSKHHWSSRPSARFINDYIFPGGELHPLSDFLSVAEETGFEIIDIEGLRRHYALTLKSWAKNLCDSKEAAIKIVGDKVYRSWLLYITGSIIAFEDGDNRVYQVLMSKHINDGDHGLPLTREDWYLS